MICVDMDYTTSIFFILAVVTTGTDRDGLSLCEDTFYFHGHIDEEIMLNVLARTGNLPSELVCCMHCGHDTKCKGIIFKGAVKHCVILYELPPALGNTRNPTKYRVMAKTNKGSRQPMVMVFLDSSIYTVDLNTKRWRRTSTSGWLYCTASSSFFFDGYVYILTDAIYKFKTDSSELDSISLIDSYDPKHHVYRHGIISMTFDKDTRELFMTLRKAVLSVDMYKKTDRIIRNVSLIIQFHHDIVHVSKTRTLFFAAKYSLHKCDYEGKRYRQITKRSIPGPWNLMVDLKGNRLIWTGFGNIFEMSLSDLKLGFVCLSEGLPIILPFSDNQLLLVGYGNMPKQKRIAKLSKTGKVDVQRQIDVIPNCKKCRIRGALLLPISSNDRAGTKQP